MNKAELRTLIEANVTKDPIRGCWLWAKNDFVAEVDGMRHMPSLLSYHAYLGFPEGKVFRTCKVHSCVNPAHLYVTGKIKEYLNKHTAENTPGVDIANSLITAIHRKYGLSAKLMETLLYEILRERELATRSYLIDNMDTEEEE